MEVKSEKSEAVVEDHAVALEVQETSQPDRATVHRGDGRAGRDAEVEAEVWPLRNAIENALRAEDIGRGGIDRGRKTPVPFALGCNPAEILLLDPQRLCDLGLLFRGRLSEFFLHRELNFDFWILGASNQEGAGKSQGCLRGGGLSGKFKRVSAGVGFEANSRQGEPGLGRGVVVEAELVPEPRPAKRIELDGWFDLEKNRRSVEQGCRPSLHGPGSGGSGKSINEEEERQERLGDSSPPGSGQREAPRQLLPARRGDARELHFISLALASRADAIIRCHAHPDAYWIRGRPFLRDFAPAGGCQATAGGPRGARRGADVRTTESRESDQELQGGAGRRSGWAEDAARGTIKTREGDYTLDSRNAHSLFCKSIHIAYPSARDRAAARAQGVSAGGDGFVPGCRMARDGWTRLTA